MLHSGLISNNITNTFSFIMAVIISSKVTSGQSDKNLRQRFWKIKPQRTLWLIKRISEFTNAVLKLEFLEQ